MTRNRAILAAAIVLGLASGCETPGKGRRDDANLGIPPGFEPKAPFEGAKGRAEGARPRGAWSSDAADIESHLNNRSADPNW